MRNVLPFEILTAVVAFVTFTGKAMFTAVHWSAPSARDEFTRRDLGMNQQISKVQSSGRNNGVYPKNSFFRRDMTFSSGIVILLLQVVA